MAQNYLYASRGTSPFQNFLQGLQGGQSIMSNLNQQNMIATREQWMRDEMANRKMMTAMKLHDDLKGMAYNNLDYYNSVYRPTMKEIGMPDQFMPEYKSVEELNQGLYRNEQMKALLKAKMEGPKVVPERGAVYEGGEFKYPEVSPARRAMLEEDRAKTQAKFDLLSQKFGQDKALQMMKHENALTQIKERGSIDRPGSYEMVETEDGPGWVEKGKPDVIPIPGARMKAKAGSDTDIRYKALRATQEQGYSQGDEGFEEKYQANLKLLAGGKKNQPPAAKSGWQGPAYYRAPDGSKKAYRTQEEYNKDFGQ